MKRLILITSIAIVSNYANAQNMILNPGFETNSYALGCYANEPSSYFNANFLNITTYYGGTSDGIDIGINDDCYAGGAHSGTTHIVMAGLIESSMFESINFGLSTPIIAGQTYNLTFYAANLNPEQVDPESLRVGISNNADSFGFPATIVPLSSNAYYTLYTTSFTASIGGNYLTIEPLNLAYFWYGLDDFSLVPSSTMAINEMSLSNYFKVFPNPTNSFITISSQLAVDATFEILDIKGKLLFQGKVENNSKIDISQLQSGFYLIKISSENQKQTFKIIKQ